MSIFKSNLFKKQYSHYNVFVRDCGLKAADIMKATLSVLLTKSRYVDCVLRETEAFRDHG